MVQIFIPYINGFFKEFIELKYALRSWENYFKEDFEIVLVGEKPEWITNITYIPHQKNWQISQDITADAINKLKLYLSITKESFFIRTYDDIFLLNDIDLKELKKVRALKYIKPKIQSNQYIWAQQKARTIEKNKSIFKDGNSMWHSETHVPEVFEVGKMNNIFKKYNVFEERLLTSTLYNHTYTKDVMLIDKHKDKAGFYGFDSWDSYGSLYNSEEIEDICKDKNFLSINETGLTDSMKKFISKKFPNKSKFEL